MERITCKRCGMVGNIDPVLHYKRYGHWPVLADGTVVNRPPGVRASTEGEMGDCPCPSPICNLEFKPSQWEAFYGEYQISIADYGNALASPFAWSVHTIGGEEFGRGYCKGLHSAKNAALDFLTKLVNSSGNEAS